MPSRPSRALGLAITAGILAVAVSGCSWRLETPPIERRTPTPTVVLRDEAAIREQTVIDVADASESGAVEAVLAPERLEALGGVYVATPSPTPSATVSVAPAPTFDAAVADAIDGALEAADAAAEDDPSLAALLRSIALSHALVSDAPAVAGEAPAERAMPAVPASGDDDAGTWTPAESSAVDPAVLAALAVTHDRASFAYEVAAARATGGERERALTRSRLHEARAAALVALPGVEDDRDGLYDVPPSGTATRNARAATERAVETEIAETYAALIDGADAVDVPWILDGAYDAWMQAASLRGFDLASLPALPGVTAAS
ncbi:DUF4439 domain-containing protein [Demequina phytophila]|uniref:DUF4439 domain-containing protein n=1 Tax=Demequina phytophila TaxID=1638981 RepID=UPI0007816828|nr:DUF4439 domain-containing protein [Demequina phytophila]